MNIDVYADVVCPWCYVGTKRLERALRDRPDLDASVRWRPFQLRPEMPAGGLPWREFAKAKFGGEGNMQTAFDHVAAAGEPYGARFDFDRIASAPNTVDAHRVILLGGEHGLQRPVANALFRAYFSGGADLNDHRQLAAVASEAGLDAAAVREHLASKAGVAEVRTSQEEAGRMGISGVPFYVFEGRYALSGAQPVEVFGRALQAVLEDRVS